MTHLTDFHANGVSFPVTSRPDVGELMEKIPPDGTLHLAILQQPYLDLIVDGTKTIESRFNTKRAAPFGRVAVGDLVLLKQSGRPITNYFFAAAVNSFALSSGVIDDVRRDYGPAICVQNDEEFWREKASSAFCTLVTVGEKGSMSDLPVVKRDQRGWVTFSRSDDTPMTLF